MQEKENVLRILEESKTAITNQDSLKLKELSDQTVHTASITNDSDNIAVAVIIYSLSKIIEREKYKKFPEWNSFINQILKSIDNAILSIQKNDQAKTKNALSVMRKSISKLSGDFKTYVQDVFQKAKINKASKIYEHGISMEKTADLLGITLFELTSYAGQKPEIANLSLGNTVNIKSRIKLAEGMFS